MKSRAKLLATLLALFATSAASQTDQQAMIERLNMLGAISTEGVYCEGMGFKVRLDIPPAEAEKYRRIAVADAKRAGISETLANLYMQNAGQSRLALIETQSQFMLDSWRVRDRKPDATLRFARQRAEACRRIADDPIGSLMVSGPLTVDEGTRNYADQLLTPMALASWQTPFIKVGGELAGSVGGCETHLTPVQTDAYLALLSEPGRVAPDVDEKAKKYFAWKRERSRKEIASDGLGATAHGYSPARCSELLTELSGLLKTAANQ
ncbi:hypothetical protein [Caulobacter sp.]|uniref:hypothetical protein n=1 Tax=Caulobacter sp. TaxID=78 RepID=UPI001B16685C|nr:hypothetical protein [Caulobacter sp.]MBO9543010.1 hypothetical protein [Caulobacter sp.]